LKEVCKGIEVRYKIQFLEIGTEKEHVHFLVQSVAPYSPVQITQIIRSITAKKIFEACPEVKKALWGGRFWAKGHYAGTVGSMGMRSNHPIGEESGEESRRIMNKYMKQSIRAVLKKIFKQQS
jgi:REP element-mobilizing transposase RayT